MLMPRRLSGRSSVTVFGIEIDDAAQRKRQIAHLPRAGKHFSLARRDFDQRSLVDHHALTIFSTVWSIASAQIGQDDVAVNYADAAFLLLRSDDVDMVVR